MVCRRYGLISNLTEKVNNPNCNRCGADLETFVVHFPIYWMKQFYPLESLYFLKNTPRNFLKLLENTSSMDTGNKANSSGWSLFEIIKHIKDANGVLNFRAKLILEKDNPSLEFKKVWTWAEIQTGIRKLLNQSWMST